MRPLIGGCKSRPLPIKHLIQQWVSMESSSTKARVCLSNFRDSFVLNTTEIACSKAAQLRPFYLLFKEIAKLLAKREVMVNFSY